MRTQVAIVGAGPAGTLLAHILAKAGIEHVVIERQSREHVLSRIRAGVLEWGTVETLRRYGLGERMDRDGHVHTSIDTVERVGKRMMAYGQTNIQEDLYRAADERGAEIVFEAEDVALHDLDTDHPSVTWSSAGSRGGATERLDCDYVAGCDGFHGVARQSIPAGLRREFEKVYPFGWVGILSETPPLPILLYANHTRGFGLCSMRNPMLSRYYVQCPLTDTVDDWPDDRFWSELLGRLPRSQAEQIVTGPSIEKSIAPLRSFVAEPMSYGRLFLAGDAAHIVPPTGAKGLNLAVADVLYLSQGLIAAYGGDPGPLERYSETALRRVWGSVRFSWWLTQLLHRFPDQTEFDQRAQEQELYHLSQSALAQAAMAEQYVGLPY